MNFAVNPSSEWNELDDRFYRKRELYTMSWGTSVDLSKLQVCGAPYGGLIAVKRDENKIVMVSQPDLRPKIDIYTSSGKKMSSILWDKGKMVGWGWLEEEKLICVEDNGSVYVYNPQGRIERTFLISRECRDHGVKECHVWGTGLVALTQEGLWVALPYLTFNRPGADLPKPRILGGGDSNNNDMMRLDTGFLPVAWAIREPQHTMSLQVEVLLATTNGHVLTVDTAGVQEHLSAGPFTQLSVSPNGKLLAGFTTTGSVLVLLADFSKKISEFKVDSKVPPNQMVWCGTDSVVCYWVETNGILVIGPYGEWINYKYDSPLYLLPEIDGVRIISNEKCEFLQRVPDATESIFKIGSTSPPAMLYDAYDHFEKKSPRADENIRQIKSDLPQAVEACLIAAANETSYTLQSTLLKAASFGKCFIDNYDSATFTEMCKAIRIINAVNHADVGFPITYNEYKALGIPALIDRLINRHHHLLACQICEYLGLRKDKVLVHWACAKVTSGRDLDPHETLTLIVQKLQKVPGISYAEIASTAFQHGNIELATKLLDYEPRAADQVPLLISMQQNEVALNKAIESGDTDLVYLVVLDIKRSARSPGDFFRILRNKPVALQLLISYCRQQGDMNLLKDIYAQIDQFQEVAHATVAEAFKTRDVDKRISVLQEALAFYTEAKDTFAAKSTEEQIRLILLQKDLEATFGVKFADESVSDTIFHLIVLGQAKRAAKVKSDFKVGDKRFWWIKIRALAQIKDWASLDKFSKEKKPPIGYEPFADVCIQAGAMQEAQKYVKKIADPLQRCNYSIQTGNYADACDAALAAKDPELLVHIRSKFANNLRAREHIDSVINQVNNGR